VRALFELDTFPVAGVTATACTDPERPLHRLAHEESMNRAWKYERNGHCLICAKPCPEKTSPTARGWDWFGGYLRVTVHFCPEHKTGELRDRLLAIGRKCPEVWTTDERAFVDSLKDELEKMERSARQRNLRRR
jgi:hypothetical protein